MNHVGKVFAPILIGLSVATFPLLASAQMVKAQTGWETSWSAKSENACYKCCRRWQTRMGWSPRRVRGVHTKVHNWDGPQLLTSFYRLLALSRLATRRLPDVRFRVDRTCR